MELKKNTVGVVLEKEAIGEDGLFHFTFNGQNIIKDNNVLYIMTDKPISDEDLRNRIKGTERVQEIIHLK